MKTEGHPVLNNVCFLDIGTGKKFLTKSTMKSPRVEKIDGQDYYVIVRDVTMDSHPAYTGEKRLVDTAGRVEKFTSKFKRGTTKAKSGRGRATFPKPSLAEGFFYARPGR